MEKRDILWNRAYILLSVANFFSWLSYNMVTPVMTEYLETLGATLSICGFVGGLFAFTSLLSRPVSGILADTFNRKRLMALFVIIMCVSLFVYAIVPSIPVIIIFRGIHGIAFGISSTASLVLVSECVPQTRMGEAISYYGVMSVASMAIGPSLGIMISNRLGHQVCMLVGAVVLAVACAASVCFPYKQLDKVVAEKKKVKFSVSNLVEVKILDLSMFNATFTMLNGLVSTFLVTYAAQKSIENVSIHFTVNAIVLIFLRVTLAKRLNMWSLRQNLVPAFLSAILSLLFIGTANSLFFLLIAAVVKAVSQTMSTPVLQTEAFRTVPYEKRGVASSTMYIGGDLGQAVGPMIGGMFAGNFGYGNMFLLCTLPLAVAFLWFLFGKRKKNVIDF